MYVDINYMDQCLDFSYDQKNFAKLPELISDTKKDHKLHWFLILDPGFETNNTNDHIFSDGYKNDVSSNGPKVFQWLNDTIPQVFRQIRM